MPLEILHGDITKFACDAIVNAANESLLGGGGVDGAIHRAAGPALLAECRALGGCRTGEAKRTGGYNLPCRYVIHTVGPIYVDGEHGEAALLAACYRNSMRLAAQSGCRSIAFPLISAGAYGYPKAEALRIALETLQAAPETAHMRVALLLYEGRDRAEAARRRAALAERLRQLQCEMPAQDALRECAAKPMQGNAMPPAERRSEKRRLFRKTQEAKFAGQPPAGEAPMPQIFASESAAHKEVVCADMASPALDDLLQHLDAGFTETLFRLIDARGMTDAECYKKAGIDRKLFSKIRSDPAYRPSKPTVLALAIALELTERETTDLLRRAGFAFSPSNAFDVIVQYYIRLGVYDMFEINEALFSFDQRLLGA